MLPNRLLNSKEVFWINNIIMIQFCKIIHLNLASYTVGWASVGPVCIFEKKNYIGIKIQKEQDHEGYGELFPKMILSQWPTIREIVSLYPQFLQTHQ